MANRRTLIFKFCLLICIQKGMVEAVEDTVIFSGGKHFAGLNNYSLKIFRAHSPLRQHGSYQNA